MEVAVPGAERIETRTTWHAWRHYVDLCRTCSSLCRV
jgi:uncharacterized protein YjiS (DUF1127 family)